ncbi:unnamed protein product [Pleuronectes platessa]|uniref:Uncharacterized protein n=1 Tax=Pleuronectes platessa TaxID=8262 RepID=A0A9N7Z6B1_PLEPL|nr:unnamed protein product [Pleuronectes platessa]
MIAGNRECSPLCQRGLPPPDECDPTICRCKPLRESPDYIRQKYNEPVEVKEVPVADKKEKSPSGSPHFYRKGTTPNQSPSPSPGPSPTPSPAVVKKTFYSSKTTIPAKPAGKENKTPAAESLTAVLECVIAYLLPTPSIPDLPTSSLPWTLPQPSVFDHEFRLFPPGYAPARLCDYTAHHWTCLPAR